MAEEIGGLRPEVGDSGLINDDGASGTTAMPREHRI